MTSGLQHLEGQLRAALCTTKPVYLLGDININILDTDSSPVHHYHTMLHELNMTQLVKRPTHLHPTPAALDHVITDQCSSAPETEVLPDAISDHQPVVVSAASACPLGGASRAAGVAPTGTPSVSASWSLTGVV
ncbi:hypothetical protein FJT64_020580 [Amphibalanus amphitrite]|uniref:Endonuclease/exonuclease/phosphatase domain-containing protein n=1 Tax=Amphibalanus amphitrite TaxID=1232801 RepID=A0A6A4WMV8_AMPAM|nr:hypothetical protein FJT64_020580 [Amphibalanus amphitrite]